MHLNLKALCLTCCTFTWAQPVRLWDQYPLPEGDDAYIPTIPDTNEDQLAQFWAARVGPEFGSPLADQVERNVEEAIILDTANIPGRLQGFADVIAANYFEIDRQGDFSASAQDIIGCLKTKTISDAALNALIQVLSKVIINTAYNGRQPLGLDLLQLLMKHNLVRSNGVELLPSSELVKVTVQMDELYLECLDDFVTRLNEEGMLRPGFLSNEKA